MSEFKRSTPTYRLNELAAPYYGEPHVAIFDYRGLTCIVRRGHIGHYCGYVLVNEDHEDHGQLKDEYSVHGGVTYSGYAKAVGFQSSLFDNLWAIGFDGGHAYDADYLVKGAGINFKDVTYKDYNFMVEQVKILADQITTEEEKEEEPSAFEGMVQHVFKNNG